MQTQSQKNEWFFCLLYLVICLQIHNNNFITLKFLEWKILKQLTKCIEGYNSTTYYGLYSKIWSFDLLMDEVDTAKARNQKIGIWNETGKVDLHINLRIQVEMKVYLISHSTLLIT